MTDKEQEIIAKLESMMDHDVYYDTGRVMSSTCTKPHEFALKVFRRYQLANLGDPSLFPGAKNVERLALRKIASLLHHPFVDVREPIGHFVSGGSEANLTALWAARNTWRKNRASKGTSNGILVAAESAHLSVEKAADLLGLRLVKVPLDEDHQMNVEWIQENLDPSKIVALSATAGTTMLGVVDPLRELSEYCIDHDIWLHVDAAIGGFIFPFYPLIGRKEVMFDFRLEGVRSITADVHKMGMCPVPGGTVLFRNSKDLENITFHLPYLLPASRMQSTMSGTRSAGSAIAFYALHELLGNDGFAEIVKNCLENVEYLKNEMKKRNMQPVIDPPPMNILGLVPVTERIKKVLELMYLRKWRVAEVDGVLRFVIMPHLKRKHLLEFLDDWDNTIAL